MDLLAHARLHQQRHQRLTIAMRRAFTIIEVLAALMIFAGASIALTSGYINVLQGYEHARTLMQADQNMKLARAALYIQTDVSAAAQGEQFDVTDGGVTQTVVWSADIAETKTADLFDVTLTVAVTPNGGTTTTTSETFRLLRPTWSDAGARTNLQTEARQKIQEIISANQSP